MCRQRDLKPQLLVLCTALGSVFDIHHPEGHEVKFYNRLSKYFGEQALVLMKTSFLMTET